VLSEVIEPSVTTCMCKLCAQFMFLAAEAVMMLSHRSLLGSSAHKSAKVTGHWLLMLLAVASAVLGKHNLCCEYAGIFGKLVMNDK